MSRPFVPGERVLLVDSKDRRYLVTLREGADFHSHAGVTPHADILGREEGATVRSGTGARYLVVRPTLSDFVLSMPRGAQVIYPKDLGPLLLLVDVFPGARVLEAGVGSGALSMALVRAGASVVGYEIRDDFAAKARANVQSFLGPGSEYNVVARDVYEGIEERELDRIVLDLPEPWRVVPHARAALRPGGILVSYLPSIVQVTQLREGLASGPFGLARWGDVSNLSFPC
jgi:tRNA (adenine57-N1/adenine58-N1)-methyltransferase